MPLLLRDTGEQLHHLFLDRVVHPCPDALAATGRDHLGGLLDGLGSTFHRRCAANASARAVDRRAGFAERAGYGAPCAPSRTGNNSDSSVECPHDPLPRQAHRFRVPPAAQRKLTAMKVTAPGRLTKSLAYRK